MIKKNNKWINKSHRIVSCILGRVYVWHWQQSAGINIELISGLFVFVMLCLDEIGEVPADRCLSWHFVFGFSSALFRSVCIVPVEVNIAVICVNNVIWFESLALCLDFWLVKLKSICDGRFRSLRVYQVFIWLSMCWKKSLVIFKLCFVHKFISNSLLLLYLCPCHCEVPNTLPVDLFVGPFCRWNPP